MGAGATFVRGSYVELADAFKARRLHTSRGWLHLGVALHPGAERYYRERGWLK